MRRLFIKLITEGWALPDSFHSTPLKTMAEREQELIELSYNQSTPILTDSSDVSVASAASDNDSYFNDSTDFDSKEAQTVLATAISTSPIWE